jgi:phage terminase large subunit GpA-like protein
VIDAPEADLEAVLARRAARIATRLWRAPEPLTGSEWANRHGWISRGSGAAEPGRYSTDRAPYLKRILDVLCDDTTHEVVVVKPAQIGLTEAMNQAVAYAMHHDPSGVIVIQPTDGLARSWMKERMDTMLDESPALQGIIRSEGGRRTSDDTLERKIFPGGWLVAVGANAPGGLRSRAGRRVFGDERSGWVLDARNQGDPWDLVTERTNTFWNRKLVQFSTPGELGTCPVTAALMKSTHNEWHVECPECGAASPWEWRAADGTYRLVCDRDAAGELIPETVQYLCTACGVLLPETMKPRMNRGGQWVPLHPGRRVEGFDFNALISPWLSWEEIIRRWNRAKNDPEKLKVFVTHVLGDAFEVKRRAIDPHDLQLRAEPLPVAPEEAGAVIAAIDVQGDRLETLEVAVGPGREMWTLRWEAHEGDPSQRAVWTEALRFLRDAEWGVPLRAIGFDTGYLPDEVYAAVRRWKRALPNVKLLPMKGIGGPGRQVVTRPARARRRAQRAPWQVGTDTAKDTLLVHGIGVPVPPGGPRALHFADTLDPAFYEQLTSEAPVLVKVGGRVASVWRKRKPDLANEALDLLVYVLAASVAYETVYGGTFERPEQGAAPEAEPEDRVGSGWFGASSGSGWRRT